MVNAENNSDLYRNALVQGQLDQFPPAFLHTLGIKGILYTIKENPTPENMALLEDAVLNSVYPDIVSFCLNSLSELGVHGNQDALETLFNLSVEHQNDMAAQLLLKQSSKSKFPWKRSLFSLLYDPAHLPVQPDMLNLITEGYHLSRPDTRRRLINALGSTLLSNLIPILTTLIDHNDSFLDTFLKLFPALTKAEKQLVYELLGEQVSDQTPFISEIICSLFVLYEDRPVLNLALSNQISPVDPIQKAVFFFLSGQWDLYQKLDFNRSLISTAFEKASESVRKRLLIVSRESGINDWLATLSQRSQSRWLNDMNTKDWIETIQSCQATFLWSELWRLSLVAPPYWSIQMLQSLAASGWQPEEDVDFFKSIIPLALDISLSLEIRKDTILSTPGKSIASIAYHSGSNRLAAGTKDQDILLWDVEKNPVSLPPLQGPVALSRIIAFDSSGEYLIAANIDNAIRIYKLPEGKLIKTLLGHSNLVRAIAFHPDGRTLFSADFDGQIIAWRFPFGTEINRYQACKGEIYSLGLSSTGNLLFSAGACGHLHGWDWDRWKEIKKLSTGASTITALSFSPASPILIFHSSNHKITIWNYETERIINEIEYPPSSPLLTSLSTLSSGKFFISGTKTGELRLSNSENGNKVASASVAGSQTAITSLALTPDDITCYSSTSDGKIYVWDLQPILSLFTPLKMTGNQQAGVIQEKIDSSKMENEKKWLELTRILSQWQRRFDIQISDNRPVSVGEFDIFL